MRHSPKETSGPDKQKQTTASQAEPLVAQPSAQFARLATPLKPTGDPSDITGPPAELGKHLKPLPVWERQVIAQSEPDGAQK